MFDRPGVEQVAEKLEQGRQDSIARQALEQDTVLLQRQATALENQVELWQGVARAEQALNETYQETLDASKELHPNEWDYIIEGARYWLPITAGVYILAQ